MKDYYQILGVKPDDDKTKIKKSYRKLAQKYHPDKNQGDESAATKFKEINEAYTVLSEDTKRTDYDHSRSPRAPRGFPGFNSDMGLGSIFETLFSGREGSPFQTGPQTHRRKDKRSKSIDPIITFKIPLSQIEEGTLCKTLQFKRNISCTYCKGVGGESSSRCMPCSGLGKTYSSARKGNMFFQNVQSCADCHGMGNIITNICDECDGLGELSVIETYDLEISCTKTTYDD